MKLKNSFLFAIGCLLLMACSDNDIPAPVADENEPAINVADDFSLSPDDAVAIASEAVMRLRFGDAATSRSEASVGLTPKLVRRYNGMASRTTMSTAPYIINFEEGGYAVVLDNPANPQVVALNDSGFFNPETQPGNAYFMELVDEYSLITSDTVSFEPNFPIGDGSETPVPPGDYPAYIMHDGHRCAHKTETVTSIEKFSLITTQWHQEAPYNRMCPIRIDALGRECHAVAGCVSIAMAQIMAYHKKPAEYGGRIFDWESITAHDQVSYYGKDAEDIAFFINELGKAVGTAYGLQASGANKAKIAPAFKAFGYVNVREMAYSDSGILSEVKAMKPVAIGAMDSKSAEQHRWIIDGAYQTKKITTRTNLDEKTICSVVSEPDTPYFHCNWGWKSADNGFYLSAVFNPGNDNYNSSFHVVYNIY